MRKAFFPIFVIVVLAAGFLFTDNFEPLAQRLPKPAAVKKKEMPEVIILAKGARIGRVTFNHKRHNGGEYNADGPIQCIECHHTAQPEAALLDVPPHITVWPAGRTTTLTSELFAEDPIKAGVAACRDCHAKPGMKPKLIDAIPTIKDPETQIVATMTNQNALHQACDMCHFQIGFRAASTKAPKATNCTSCHKTSAKNQKR